MKKVGFLARVTERTDLSPVALAIIIILGLLVWEQITYLSKKKHLPGPSYKIPIIGAMMDSMKPTFEGYVIKWESGDLSCVSVFNR